MTKISNFLALPMVLAFGGCSVQPHEAAPIFTPVVYTQHTAEKGACEKVTQVITSIDQFGSGEVGLISIPNMRTTIQPAPCDATSKPYAKESAMRMVPAAKAQVVGV